MTMIPDSAPFSEEQRAWLNGFFSGFLGIEPSMVSDDALAAAGLAVDTVVPPAEVEEEDFPWHEPDLPIIDRMALADGKPLDRKLMAAMAQLDCGSCGYICESYSAAIADGSESDLSLCSPGGKETKQMIKKLLKEGGGAGANGAATAPASDASAGISRNNPFAAKLCESRPLNGDGSAKDTRHVAIDLSGSQLNYKVGDALGVWPTNCNELTGSILSLIDGNVDQQVNSPLGGQKSLATVLCEDCCLKDPSDELLECLIAKTSDPQASALLQTLLDDGVADGWDVLDMLKIASDVRLSADEFVSTLEKIKPRLYSIASSMKAVGNEVHLTIGKVSYEREERVRKGVASTMFSDRVEPGHDVRVFVHENQTGFTVPSNDVTPMIMIGPGTGIAPFMAFLQEREALKASGKNWLFFGDQHEATDFLYQQELEAWSGSGLLTHLSTAFSRDGNEKVYVQDRMLQQAAEFWQWIEEGACVYVCGDASRMAADVDRALVSICEQEGKMSPDEARSFVSTLSADKRYVRDVY